MRQDLSQPSRRTPKHALVLGAGSSGRAAARLLRAEGARVTVVDRREDAAARAALERDGAVLQVADETALPAGDFDACVVSPGVPERSAWVAAARARGLVPVSELELGWSRFSGRTIAVTGSNGKSTMVKWLAECLQAAGQRAAPAGNYGPPVCQVVQEQPGLDWLVLEVSSFQLETMEAFRAEAALLLNLVPNHLDRHGDMDTYRAMKARLFARAEPGDHCVAHAPVLAAVRALAGGAGRWAGFGPGGDYAWRDGAVLRGAEQRLLLRGTLFDNPVLGENAAGAVAVLDGVRIPLEAAGRAAATFQPLPHRMELVGVLDGVRYVNDSKCTTLAAMAAALRMAGPRARLIAGGLLKENDLDVVKETLALQASGVYLIGRASSAMVAAWSGVVPCVLCDGLEEALERARGDARTGETVLLSPGCASFDQFSNYGERGDRFRRWVASLMDVQQANLGQGTRS